jgi:predicted kinase
MSSIVYLPCGPPGIGKSTLTKRAVDSGLVTPDGILASDFIRTAMAGTVADQTVNFEVFEVLYLILAKRLERGLNAWIDATNMTHQESLDWLAWSEGATIVAITFPYDPARANAQNQSRADGRPPVPQAVMDRFFDVWKEHDPAETLPIAHDEGRLEVVTSNEFLQNFTA